MDIKISCKGYTNEKTFSYRLWNQVVIKEVDNMTEKEIIKELNKHGKKIKYMDSIGINMDNHDNFGYETPQFIWDTLGAIRKGEK